jgi:hypothetical protein
MRRTYPTDLSDAEWSCLKPHLPAPKADGCPRVYPLREILNAVFYVVRSLPPSPRSGTTRLVARGQHPHQQADLLRLHAAPSGELAPSISELSARGVAIANPRAYVTCVEVWAAAPHVAWAWGTRGSGEGSWAVREPEASLYVRPFSFLPRSIARALRVYQDLLRLPVGTAPVASPVHAVLLLPASVFR